MFIKEPCKETDAHPWNDADESIIERIVLQGKLQKQTWRPQGLNEGEESEQESHQRSYLRSCHQGTDNGGDMKNGGIHYNQGNKSVPRKAQKNGNSCQKTGYGQLTDT